MNIDSLKYFVTVVECGSFSKAAELLYVTQPALSRSIQRLEKELGQPLLERSRQNGITITKFGESCLADMKQIVSCSNRIDAKAEASVQDKSGTVTIGYNGMEGALLYKLTDHLHKKFPHIKVLFRHECLGELFYCVLDGVIDVTFLFQGLDYSDGDSLCCLPRLDSRLKLLVPNRHPFAKCNSVRLDELKEEPFVVWQRAMCPEMYDAFHQLCQQHGFSPKTICEDETYAVFSYISAGDGIGYINSGMEAGYGLQDVTTVDIELDDGSYMPNWPLCLAWNKNNKNPCIRPVLKIAEQYLRHKKEE